MASVQGLVSTDVRERRGAKKANLVHELDAGKATAVGLLWIIGGLGMRIQRHFELCSATACLLMGLIARADVINGGFEDGPTLTTPWNVRGTASVRQHDSGNYVLFEEPGTGGVSQLWQSVLLPASPAASFLTFRYRFDSPRNSAQPQLIAAFSRKVHGSPGLTIDFDILGGETECRSATIELAETDLTIVAKFDRRISLLGLASGDIVSDVGEVGTIVVAHDIVEIPITQVPHAARVNLSFPGLTDWEFPTFVNTTDARFCAVVETGDYDGDGQTTDEDVAAHLDDYPGTQTVDMPDFARGDVNLDGVVDVTDRNDITNLPLPLAAMGCPSGRPIGNSSPPDSFQAFLLSEQDTGSLPTGMSLDDTMLNTAFLYNDSNGSLKADRWVTVSSEPDFDGMFAVSLDLSGIGTNQLTRVVFALAGAANEMTSVLSLDDVALDCPPGWCCDPTTGIGEPTDDGDDCTADTCGAGGVIVRTPSDADPPVITCPLDTVVTDSARRGPEYTGYATAVDNCSEPAISDPPKQFVHLGCPTIVHRFWDATDETGNVDTCTQFITDLDSDAPFYSCLTDRLEACYSPDTTCKIVDFDVRVGVVCRDELDPDILIDASVASGCTCSVAEVLTECFRQLVKGQITKGGIQSCVAHNSADLESADLICQNDKGAVNSCVANQLGDLYDWLTGQEVYQDEIHFDQCNGGPAGTDVCDSASDCVSDFDSTTYDCCVRNDPADPFGWCEYRATSCP